jgi:AcrR family transcriptional regulator
MASPRRTNDERTEATRAALLDAARVLFVDKGYAATGTPEIVAVAGLTRGALYHHFADKAAVLRAVLEREAAAVAAEIERASHGQPTARAALLAGAEAYFAAMSRPGRTRMLLLDGPAVLGRAEMDRIDRATAAGTLRDGLAHGMAQGELRPLPLEALTTLLSAAFDRAALAIADGAAPPDYRATIEALLDGLCDRR